TLAMAQVSPEKVFVKNGVSYVSGGVGVDSEERLKAREKEFNLKLVFTLVEGNYLADIAVAIKDGGGKTVIEHVADGPFFMAKLPAGTYAVSAVYEGKTQTRKVAVRDGRLRTEYLRWPSNPKQDLPVSRWLEPEEQQKEKAGPKPRG
ncbi:MAG: hypothetical protein Q8L40_06615, partial [Burkholderiales bacterium]|nr:hypothetical protein [Burkholderiales bacterium]